MFTEVDYESIQWRVFAVDLANAFVRRGFEIVEQPYMDPSLAGFRAVYMRQYLLHTPTAYYNGILTTFIHVVGLPFGRMRDKMVIMSAARNINNESIGETMKLRLQFDSNGLCYVAHPDTKNQCSGHLHDACSDDVTTYMDDAATNQTIDEAQNDLVENMLCQAVARKIPQLPTSQCNHDAILQVALAQYVAHILEKISPGLIELPDEMKLEILKKLNIDAIIKMSQVSNEFRTLIFRHGETLWRHLCYRDFNITHINRFVHKSWMELYRDSYITNQYELCRKERALPGLPERPALPPAPYRLQIEWFPEVLELPYYPMHNELVVVRPPTNQLDLALNLVQGLLRRADSLESMNI